MLTQNNYLDVHTAGPMDLVCILKLPTGRFHVAFYEEHPMPGPVKSIHEIELVRLKSKMHHTAGAATIEEAREHVAELRQRIQINDANVITDEALELANPISTLYTRPWFKCSGPITVKDLAVVRMSIGAPPS